MKDAFQWMVPFLHRCEGQEEGAAKALLRKYLVSLAERDLTLPLLIFQQSKPDVSAHTNAQTYTHSLTETHVRKYTQKHTGKHLNCVATLAMSGPMLHPLVAGVLFTNP